MSDDQVAFDNWQDAAQQLQKEQLQHKDDLVTKVQGQQLVPDEINQQKISQKEVPLDPKEVLKAKIKKYQDLSIQQFEQESEQITEKNLTVGKKLGNPVLKSDKDFSNYAKQLAKRFDNMIQNQDATVQDEKLCLFVQELTLYMYKNLQWKNLHEIQNKLKVIKKQRKAQDQKRRKQKQKNQRTKKLQGQESQSLSQSHTRQKKEDDLFGGTTMITSKQEEEERKNKIIVQAKVQTKQDQDDDDFM